MKPSREDLPDPDSPTSPNVSPSLTVKDVGETATTCDWPSPYTMETFSSVINSTASVLETYESQFGLRSS